MYVPTTLTKKRDSFVHISTYTKCNPVANTFCCLDSIYAVF